MLIVVVIELEWRWTCEARPGPGSRPLERPQAWPRARPDEGPSSVLWLRYFLPEGMLLEGEEDEKSEEEQGLCPDPRYRRLGHRETRC